MTHGSLIMILYVNIFSKLLEEGVNKYHDYNRNLAVKYKLHLVSPLGSNVSCSQMGVLFESQ